jgi:uncharacterized protein
MEKQTHIRPEYIIEDETELRSIFSPTHAIALKKCQDHLDKHARFFLSRSPFMCIGTQSSNGLADVSPRGDPRGFVKILDDKTLLIPDRPGNNRLDTQSNILANPSVGLLFMIPGFDETLRVNGKAQISRDPELLTQLAVEGKSPKTVIIVEVAEVYLHCAKAFRRAKLWDPSQHQNRSEMPSLLNIILDQTTGAPEDPNEMKKIDDNLEIDYKNSMY